jgi:hypothetical protein
MGINRLKQIDHVSSIHEGMMLSLSKTRMGEEGEKSFKEAMSLPMTASCRDLLYEETVGLPKKYKLQAPFCTECLVSPGQFHMHPTSYMILSKTSLKLTCSVHGHRFISGRDLSIIKKALKCIVSFDDDEEDKTTPYERLMVQMEDHARRFSLKKKKDNKMVYRPVACCPNAYEPYMTFSEYIDHVLRGDPDYRANVRRLGELRTYLEEYNEDAFPNLVVDVDLLSFANGVLELSSNTFVHYNDEPALAELKGRVARHHITRDYSGSHATPLFDSIFLHQFSPDDGRMEILYALFGRLLFKVRQMDRWQVAPLLLGEAGTGKSAALAVISAMFDGGAIGEIDNNNEKTFGLQDKFNKEVIFIRDAPLRMSDVLPQEQFQKMVSGEGLQVSVKHGMAFTVPWQSHIIAASNTMFNYEVKWVRFFHVLPSVRPSCCPQ